MGRKYKYKLLEKEVATINKILIDNEVQFSFDDIKNYLNAIEEVAPVLHESYNRYLKFINSKEYEKLKNPSEQFIQECEEKIKLDKWRNNISLRSEEYLVTDDMKLISSGYAYPYRFHDCCPLKNVSECSDIVNIIFSEIDITDCIFDYWNSEYGLVYQGDGSDNVFEGLYLWVNSNILDRTSLEEKQIFFQYLLLDESQIDFICSNDSNVGLDYIGFNAENKIVKYAVKFPRYEYFDKNPNDYYEDYSKMKSVISCLKKSNSKTNITMQFVPGKSEAIAIETEVSVEEYKREVNRLVSSGILEKMQGEMMLSMPIEKYHHTMFKYKWDIKDEFQLKVYYLQDRLTK
jgi:hypothetical protein